MAVAPYWKTSKIWNTDLQFQSPAKMLEKNMKEEERQFKEFCITNALNEAIVSQVHEPKNYK